MPRHITGVTPIAGIDESRVALIAALKDQGWALHDAQADYSQYRKRYAAAHPAAAALIGDPTAERHRPHPPPAEWPPELIAAGVECLWHNAERTQLIHAAGPADETGWVEGQRVVGVWEGCWIVDCPRQGGRVQEYVITDELGRLWLTQGRVTTELHRVRPEESAAARRGTFPAELAARVRGRVPADSGVLWLRPLPGGQAMESVLTKDAHPGSGVVVTAHRTGESVIGESVRAPLSELLWAGGEGDEEAEQRRLE